MKTKSLRITVTMIVLLVISCDEPETIVTNYVHPDGSVTRKIEMRFVKNEFNPKDYQVPFDTSWRVKDSIEISEKGDTTWVKKAEKTFPDAASITSAYKNDTAVNSGFDRSVYFEKHFRWFNTEYRFAEKVGKIMQHGYPVSDYLSGDELQWFYSPQELRDKQMNSADSLKYKHFSDTIDKKTEKWMVESVFSEWIAGFSNLTAGKGSENVIGDLKSREKELSEMILERYIEKWDSLWEHGIILNDLIGKDNAEKFRTEADSSMGIAIKELMPDFRDYKVSTVMPGRLTGTNGFSDSTGVLLWPVTSDLFLTQDYEMWAESKTSNTWAWVISAVFIGFVLTGLAIRIKKG
jgi:hypothetical protein